MWRKRCAQVGEYYEVSNIDIGYALLPVINQRIAEIFVSGRVPRSPVDYNSVAVDKSGMDRFRKSLQDWLQLFANAPGYVTANYYAEDMNLACASGRCGRHEHGREFNRLGAALRFIACEGQFAIPVWIHFGEEVQPAFRDMTIICLLSSSAFWALTNTGSVGSVHPIFRVLQDQITTWADPFKGTPAEPIATGVVQFSDDCVNCGGCRGKTSKPAPY